MLSVNGHDVCNPVSAFREQDMSIHYRQVQEINQVNGMFTSQFAVQACRPPLYHPQNFSVIPKLQS